WPASAAASSPALATGELPAFATKPLRYPGRKLVRFLLVYTSYPRVAVCDLAGRPCTLFVRINFCALPTRAEIPRRDKGAGRQDCSQYRRRGLPSAPLRNR